MPTERDVILAKREGFYKGSAWRWERCRPGGINAHERTPDEVARAAELFPLPMVRRPRVVFSSKADSMREFRLVDGTFQARNHFCRDSEWTTNGFTGWEITPDVIELFARLVNSPTIEVRDEEPAA